MVSGILHLGNVLFREEGSERAVIEASESEGYFFLFLHNTVSPRI